MLYLSDGNKGHYCYIKNLSRLVSKQITSRNDAVYICDGCLLYFPSEDKLKNHQNSDCIHVYVDLPSREKLKKNWFGQIESNNILRLSISREKLKFLL